MHRSSSIDHRDDSIMFVPMTKGMHMIHEPLDSSQTNQQQNTFSGHTASAAATDSSNFVRRGRRSTSWFSWTNRVSQDDPDGHDESSESQSKEKSEARNLILPSPEASPSFLLHSDSVDSIGHANLWREVLRLIGPGWLVAMAYVDPGNLEGDLLAGAIRSPDDPYSGYRLLWVLLWSTAIGFALQRLAIKLGTVTRKDLATHCYLEFPPHVSRVIWLVTELCLIGADVQAVVGSAIGLQLIFGLPLPYGIVITLVDSFIVLLIDFCGTRKLEGCFAILISLLAGCFIANMWTSNPVPEAILSGLLIPSIPEGSLPFTLALVGSIIMPHNFFLQSAVVQSRPLRHNNSELEIRRTMKIHSIETFFLLFISLIVNIAVVVAFANPGIIAADIKLDLYNAHIALESVIGKHSAIIWGVGLLAAGQCSTMACTYAGQFIMEGLLGLRIEKLWVRVFVTRLTAIIPLLFLVKMGKGTVESIANWVNIMLAFNLPFTLVILLKLTTSERIMGKFAISTKTKVISYVAGFLIVAANVNLMVVQLGGLSWIVAIVLTLYFSGLGYLFFRPIQQTAPLVDTRPLLHS